MRLRPTCISGRPAVQVMLDELRLRLSSREHEGRAVHALRAVLSLLLHGAHDQKGGMTVPTRHHCVALLGSALDALPGAACTTALRSAELRQEVADAALVFLATCCRVATTAPG